MTVRPLSINQNQCCEFPTNAMEELSVMAGGYKRFLIILKI